MTAAVINAARISKQEKEHGDNEQGAFDQIFLDRLNRAIDKRGAVVYRLGHDAVWQAVANLLQFLRHTE